MFSIFMRSMIKILLMLLSTMLAFSAMAENSNSKMGVVIMHGKGGSPTKFVADLASVLEKKGYLVANLEMPWSGKRNYDVSVSAADKEVETALNKLREQGAKKVFLAGHSQGGLFAFHYVNDHVVDGVIAMAPGGNVANKTFMDKLGESVEKSRKMIAEGKGNETTSFGDYEGSKGVSSFVTTPSIYLGWFAPEGAMNERDAIRLINPAIPVLYIAPTKDYPGLLKSKQEMVSSLPVNPRTKVYEPNSSHLDTPSASIDEIVAWTTAIAQAQ